MRNNPLRRPSTLRTACQLALCIGALPSAQAQVFGSLANFDAVNNTGHEAHGFEIRIEDPSYTRASLYSVFGLDRNFGVPPTSVERYGAPLITELPGIGVTIRYQASFANGAWSVGTPTGPYPLAGDSCWPLGNPQYASGTLTCDHFGVATYGSPAKTTYSWLIDPGNTGTLTAVTAALPAVNFAYQPPAPGPVPVARPVVAEIEAHRENGEVFGTPYWVKVYSKHLDHDVKLDDLMHKNPDVPGDAEVEVEWELFQAGGDNGLKQHGVDLAAADQALVLRYEFYQYLGERDALGEALCSGKGGGGGGKRGGVGAGVGGGGNGPDACGGLGDYVGAQIAGFNAVQAPLAAVPEPASAGLLAAGLGLLCVRLSRRRL
ncbi:PEP-CTERM sorting domain-containing protein [Ideonella sp. DXS22W]|uniref:PEP-CTERM sorting domain-containing protein n=1 Tax=Pseudaquabacterium inlustre TaxID=2984192 RepID=A0ABU9CLY2_9BURK